MKNHWIKRRQDKEDREWFKKTLMEPMKVSINFDGRLDHVVMDRRKILRSSHWISKKHPDHVWTKDACALIPKEMLTDKEGEWVHMVVITTHDNSYLFMDGKEVGKFQFDKEGYYK
tara:strand:- start:117 stop:464 length:348 start_codon:yes stop_codon:yes gene_type:complete